MRVLWVTQIFPSPAEPYAGIFVLKQAEALRQIGLEIEILTPVPWSPPFAAMLSARFGRYRGLAECEEVRGFRVWRRPYIQFPGDWYVPWQSKLGVLAARQWASVWPGRSGT